MYVDINLISLMILKDIFMATSKTDLLYYLEIENLVLANLGKGGNN